MRAAEGILCVEMELDPDQSVRGGDATTASLWHDDLDSGGRSAALAALTLRPPELLAQIESPDAAAVTPPPAAVTTSPPAATLASAAAIAAARFAPEPAVQLASVELEIDEVPMVDVGPYASPSPRPSPAAVVEAYARAARDDPLASLLVAEVPEAEHSTTTVTERIAVAALATVVATTAPVAHADLTAAETAAAVATVAKAGSAVVWEVIESEIAQSALRELLVPLTDLPPPPRKTVFADKLLMRTIATVELDPHM
jgi:hypothetical protein